MPQHLLQRINEVNKLDETLQIQSTDTLILNDSDVNTGKDEDAKNIPRIKKLRDQCLFIMNTF